MTASIARLFFALLLCGCAATQKKIVIPDVPAPPIGKDTLLGDCDGNPIAYQARDSRQAGAEIRCTRRIGDIAGLLGSLDAQSTLLVLDIDDTLLTSDTFFGSDAWYEWQRDAGIPAAARPMCKFDIIALNYEAGTQHAVEGQAGVDLINGLDLPKLLLTSRSAHYRGGTERELLNARYQLPRNLLRAEKKLPGDHGISWTAPDKRGNPTPISYAHGILMVTGADKGDRLVELLHYAGLHYKHIVLVDDGIDNINSLSAAVPATGAHYYGFWYRKVDKSPKPGDEAAAIQALSAWQNLVQTHYPNRARRWSMPGEQGCGK